MKSRASVENWFDIGVYVVLDLWQEAGPIRLDLPVEGRRCILPWYGRCAEVGKTEDNVFLPSRPEESEKLNKKNDDSKHEIKKNKDENYGTLHPEA
ncbi:hypothetical protein HNY73_009707 [Argiope bruennichi]|uniref:Uncharacterized protein n=1 Tax=Argiope bruennichi TaxID=94029 RepID=A0A8T0FAH0_ARGBR|nr:hypothetical protein HNY73_009707 [Argiope bruennichi]